MKFHEPSNPWLERFAQSDPLSIEVSLDILKKLYPGKGEHPFQATYERLPILQSESYIDISKL